eukprot:1389278-Lingulodinium_polyedra.AAC.1
MSSAEPQPGIGCTAPPRPWLSGSRTSASPALGSTPRRPPGGSPRGSGSNGPTSPGGCPEESRAQGQLAIIRAGPA